MVRQRQRYIKYPNKTVLQDLITRRGPATSESFTPFNGCADIVQQQFCGRQSNRYNERDFIAYNTNYDFDPKKVKVRQTSGMLVSANKVAGDFTRLEDFVVNGQEREEVAEWVRDACIGYKTSNKSPYNQKIEYSRVIDNGEDEPIEEQMLLVKYEDTKAKQKEREDNIKKLPYYIRTIWNYSIMYKANLFGFIYAWMYLVYDLNRSRLIPGSFNMNFKYVRLKPDGTFYRYFEYSKDIKDPTFSAVIRLFINPGDHPVEMAVIKEFSDIIRALDIDYTREDCMDINNDLIRKMKCTYLPSVKEYTRHYADLDIEVNYAIKAANLFSTKKIDIYKNSNLTVEENNENMFIRKTSDQIKLLYKGAILYKDNYRGIKNDVVSLFDHSPEDTQRLIEAYIQIGRAHV